MRNIIFIMALAPIIGKAQITDKLFAEFNIVYVDDLEYTDKDVNSFSPDMYSGHNEKSDIENGINFSVGYKYSANLSFGFTYSEADISASNDIEYYKGSFNDMSTFITYDLYKIQNFMLFGYASMGEIEYKASRYLVFDDSELPINSPNGTANKMALGFGLKMNMKNNMAVVAKYIINEIDDDGFDGWDYGSGVDRYADISIGLRLDL